jgi:molybdopterin converting factor small subunit
MKFKLIIPELKINLIHCENVVIVTNEKYKIIQELVDEYVRKYGKIYPNFLITYLNIYVIDENNYKIDELSIEFTYLKEIIYFSQLNENEKIYISKEKIKIIGLKEFFEEIKLQPFEECEINISMYGETYRQLRDNFNSIAIKR